MASDADPARISPTAYYTGHVWVRQGLSPAALDTTFGRRFFRAVQPAMDLARGFTGGLTLEEMLVQRHRIIDHLLDRAILEGRVGQVIEIASGVASRSVRVLERHGARGVRYLEADLPGMIERKRAALSSAGLLRSQLELHPIDARRSDGDGSLEHLVQSRLDPRVGTAIITEGLLSYLPWTDVSALWRRIAVSLRGFPHGLYLTDLHLAQVTRALPVSRVVRRAIGAIVRGRTYTHVHTPEDGEAVMHACGFAYAKVHSPREFAEQLALPAPNAAHAVHVGEARVAVPA